MAFCPLCLPNFKHFLRYNLLKVRTTVLSDLIKNIMTQLKNLKKPPEVVRLQIMYFYPTMSLWANSNWCDSPCEPDLTIQRFSIL
jgi:hypothetical protein